MIDPPYITIYTLENGREELSYLEWFKLHKVRTFFHRVDGPAIVWRPDVRGPSWYIEGEQLKEDAFNKLIQEVKDMPLVLKLVDPRQWVREFKE